MTILATVLLSVLAMFAAVWLLWRLFMTSGWK